MSEPDLTVTLLGTGSPMPDPNRAELATLILPHYVPAMPLSGTEDDWRALAAEHFDGTIEIGDDLHRVVVSPRI